LTKEGFYHAFAHLRKGQRTLQRQNAEILRLLRFLEPAISIQRPPGSPPVVISEDLQSIRKQMDPHLNRQITKEKNSKRYIPDVFVEVSYIKDQARFFSHPVLFYGKVLDAVNRLSFSILNRRLVQLSHEPIYLGWPETFEPAKTLEGVSEQSFLLQDVLRDAQSKISEFATLDPSRSIAAIPDEKQYIYRKNWLHLSGPASALKRQMDECIGDLKTVQSQVLFLIARAGQGKTNFVCDFAENVLRKRALPCLFFTGRELGRVELDEIEEYIVGSVFGERYNRSVDEMLKKLEKVCLADQVPLTFIIDGINEHRDIGKFSYWLERFVERILEYPFVRLILACRSEYFEERFANFREASFADRICFVEDVERYMSSMHRDHLIEAYFRFFGLRCPYLSVRAEEILKNDMLLLRVFCEAYGDHLSEEAIHLPQILHIYRDEVFKLYLDKKLEGASQYSDNSPRLPVGVGVRYKRLLSRIIHLMIERNQFSNLPVVDLGEEHYLALSELLGEDIIVRKDLADGTSVLDEKSEVINFTFDEFRDFLLANHLVVTTFEDDPKKFEEIVDRIITAESPVAEGVSKFLFFASKRPECGQVRSAIASSSWYKGLFLDCIFEVKEDLIAQNDLKEIEARFLEGPQQASQIIRMLIGRWRIDAYPILNIDLLFQILDGLDVSEHKRLVEPAFRRSPRYRVGETAWPIEYLVNEIRGILIDGELEPCFEKLAELLIYLFDIRGSRHTFPAYIVFGEFAEQNPDIASELLEGKVGIRNQNIAIRVWNMLKTLADQGEIPDDLVDEACQLLLGLHESEMFKQSELARSVSRFLKSCHESKGIDLPDAVIEAIEERVDTPHSLQDLISTLLGEDHDNLAN
jgi:hypothetical protein